MSKIIERALTHKAVLIAEIGVNYQMCIRDRLRDKCVVITGGSEGIGAAIARKCISQGARVLITGRDEVKLHNFADAVDRDKVSVLNWDISDCTVIEEKFKQVLNELGQVDIWINNAGIYRDVNYSSCRLRDWDEIMSRCV